MLTFSKKEEYSIQFVTYLAKHQDSPFVSLSTIAKDEGISLPFLRKIANDLRLAGLVKATEGKLGGYVLAKKPQEISVAHVLEAVEKKKLITCCDDPLEQHGHVCQCGKEALWKRINKYQLKNYYRITFDKLVLD